jgi:hypothetical protein
MTLDGNKNRHRVTMGSRRRRGVMAVAALTCLLVVVAIVVGMVTAALRSQRLLEQTKDCRQADLLVEAGANRAAARLGLNPKFRGDVWELTASEISGRGSARITSEIVPATDSKTVRMHVAVEYTLGPANSIRRSHDFPMSTSISDTKE